MSVSLEKGETSSTLRGEGMTEGRMIGEGALEVSSVFYFALSLVTLSHPISGGMDWGREPRPGPPMGFGGGGGLPGGRGGAGPFFFFHLPSMLDLSGLSGVRVMAVAASEISEAASKI